MDHGWVFNDYGQFDWSRIKYHEIFKSNGRDGDEHLGTIGAHLLELISQEISLKKVTYKYTKRIGVLGCCF